MRSRQPSGERCFRRSFENRLPRPRPRPRAHALLKRKIRESRAPALLTRKIANFARTVPPSEWRSFTMDAAKNVEQAAAAPAAVAPAPRPAVTPPKPAAVRQPSGLPAGISLVPQQAPVRTSEHAPVARKPTPPPAPPGAAKPSVTLPQPVVPPALRKARPPLAQGRPQACVASPHSPSRSLPCCPRCRWPTLRSSPPPFA